MERIYLLFSFLKSFGGPRNLIYIALFLILGGILIYQYFQNRKSGETKYIILKDRKLFTEGNKFQDSLIAGLALVLVICFLIIASLLIYLLYEA